MIMTNVTEEVVVSAESARAARPGAADPSCHCGNRGGGGGGGGREDLFCIDLWRMCVSNRDIILEDVFLFTLVKRVGSAAIGAEC